MDCRKMQTKKYTDEELLQIIRDKTEELGRLPIKRDVPDHSLIKARFGPWPRALEAAGVKEVSAVYLNRINRKKERKQEKKTRAERRLYE